MNSIAFKALCLSILFAQFSLGEASKPNVIFILMDDMGYSDVSCYGAKKVKTPHIDKLAAGGLRFTDFHTGSSICSPSRAAFLTGAYPQRSGLYMGINENREAHWFLGLNPDEITLAEQFKNSDKIFVNNFGLSASDGEIDITYDGLSSSGIDLKPDSKSYVGKLKSFEDYVVSKSISKIKLLKMNIEGGEYDLLESLVGTPRVVMRVSFFR